MSWFGDIMRTDLASRRGRWITSVIGVAVFVPCGIVELLAEGATRSAILPLAFAVLASADVFYLAASGTYAGFGSIGRTRRIARQSQNRCPRCSYDLRASTSVSCPECGEWLGFRPALANRRRA